jgi:hypothetical protein
MFVATDRTFKLGREFPIQGRKFPFSQDSSTRTPKLDRRWLQGLLALSDRERPGPVFGLS